ncbi:hypothetical protein LguiA_013613 [Lonicera macranthoides]
MGKKGSKKKSPNVFCGSQASISLREESTGKKQTNVNAKTMLKVEHVKNLSVWASGEASIPSLGAFFGHRLAASTEALGIPPDPSLFTCQRCECVLQPGYNCTIRIEKNRAKLRRRRKKPSLSSQNNVVYNCHFCSHRNLIRGTPLGHMKAICPQEAKSSSKPDPVERKTLGNVEFNKTGVVEAASVVVPKCVPVSKSPATPLVRPGRTLLDGKMNEVNKTAMPEAEDDSAIIPKSDLAVPGDDPVIKTPSGPLVRLYPSLLDGKTNEVNKLAEAEAAPAVAPKADLVVPRGDLVTKSPATPLVKPGPTLLEGKRRKRNRSGSKKAGESEGGSDRVDEEKVVNTSSKRKRKSWTSLKEIVESSKHNNSHNLKNLAVPFSL